MTSIWPLRRRVRPRRCLEIGRELRSTGEGEPVRHHRMPGDRRRIGLPHPDVRTPVPQARGRACSWSAASSRGCAPGCAWWCRSGSARAADRRARLRVRDLVAHPRSVSFTRAWWPIQCARGRISRWRARARTWNEPCRASRCGAPRWPTWTPSPTSSPPARSRPTGSPRSRSQEVSESWARPSVDLVGDVVVVLDGDLVVAWAETYRGRGEGFVLPPIAAAASARRWWSGGRPAPPSTASRSPARPSATTIQPQSSCCRASAAPSRHTSWILQLPLGDEPPAPAAPPTASRSGCCNRARSGRCSS